MILGGEIVSLHTQALVFNGVPLVVLAVLYLGVTAALAPLVLRERARATALELAFVSLFPAIGILTGLLGALVLAHGEALGGHVWVSLVAIFVAFVPPALALYRWGDRGVLVAGWFTAREAEQRATARDRELDSVALVAHSLARAPDAEAVGRALIDQIVSLLEVDFVGVMVVDQERHEARGLLARSGWKELEWFPEAKIDLEREISGVARAVAESRPIVVDDAEASQIVSHRLVEATGVKSVVFVPLVTERQTVAVMVVGTTGARREFAKSELVLLQAVAGEGALALDRTRLLRENEERLTHLSALLAEQERRVRFEQGFYRIASVLAEPLSLAETLDALALAACEALGGDFGAALMPDSAGLELAGSHDLPGELAEIFRGGVPPAAAVLADCSARGDVVAAGDVLEDDRFGPEWRAAARDLYRSLLAIPVDTEAPQKRGLVLVFFSEQRSFSDEDLELARHLAHAAKGALERSRMFERERASRALSQELARTGSLLATELEPARVLAEVVAQVPRLLGADSCTVAVLDDDELRVRGVEGLDLEEVVGKGGPSTFGFAGEVVQSGAPVAVAEVAQDDPRREVDPVLAAGRTAYLGVPLSGAEGGLIGVLSVYSRESREWQEEEVEALLAIAGTASAALSNAELYQRVAEEKERSEAILANVADGIIAVDRDDRVVLWNAAAEQITGVPREEAVGRRSVDVLKRNLAAAEAGEHAKRIRSIPRGGEDVWLSLTEAVILDPAGEASGRIYTFRDISTERLVEQMKSDFVSTVSHQLRAPLTSIYGFAETLLRNDVLFGEEERRTFLRYVVAESERLAAIVDTLLNVARLEAGDMTVDLAPIDLCAVVSEVIDTVQQTASGNGHEFVADLPTEPLTADADREKLRQVLANLLDNAVKFSPHGGKVTVSARRTGESETVEIQVTDEGMGIPHAEQQLIFSKFYRRADWADQEGAGAGLGLFIAQGLVSAMGGDIRVSSIEGRGASFVFELPLAAEARA